jgi:hypothetical protein
MHLKSFKDDFPNSNTISGPVVSPILLDFPFVHDSSIRPSVSTQSMPPFLSKSACRKASDTNLAGQVQIRTRKMKGFTMKNHDLMRIYMASFFAV